MESSNDKIKKCSELKSKKSHQNIVTNSSKKFQPNKEKLCDKQKTGTSKTPKPQTKPAQADSSKKIQKSETRPAQADGLKKVQPKKERFSDKQPAVSNAQTKPAHGWKSKKKPWQKYNPRISEQNNNESTSINSSESEDETPGKYKKRAITDNHGKFEHSSDEESKLKEEEEAKVYEELFKDLRLRDMEKDKSLTEGITVNHSQISSTVVLPEEFEQELDVLLSLTVPHCERSGSPIISGNENSENFSLWLDDVLEPEQVFNIPNKNIIFNKDAMT